MRWMVVIALMGSWACGAGSSTSALTPSADAREGEPDSSSADAATDGPPDASPEDVSVSDAAPADEVAADPCAALASSFVPVASPSDPPFGGTLFLTPDILTGDDPTSFVGLTFKGQAERLMFDRRIAAFATFTPYLFEARYGAATVVEVQVNPEFTREQAEAEALRYAEPLGRVPAFYFRDLETMWIHAGDELAGGGNNNILIHTGGGEGYIRDGLLEELYLHEGAHTSLDAYHAAAPDWLAAQQADGGFLSDYGRDYPEREDVAESIGPYLAVRYFRDRIDPELVATIEAVMPNRIRYFDCQGLSVERVR